MVAELRDRGIGFTCSTRTWTPGGRLVVHVFAALAEFIRELIVIGTNEGLVAARTRVGGRPTVATEEVIKAARDLLPDPGPNCALALSPVSSKLVRGRRAPARSFSPGFPVPQPLISDHGIGVLRSFPCGRVGPTGPSRGRSGHGSRRSDRRRHRVGPRLSARGGREECG
ncbi:recombinase family protein [Streptomyces sp. A1547]|uniref:recombinase family protein n=1 Tax=Streptomyces sp. A1547 TaxID=2563105 RepID=UPI00144ACFF7|nr:recombinase family protein [Streptomyces sp. A1547]